METVCICCPIGCRLNISRQGEEILVEGNACPRGKTYGITEFTSPKRVLTTSVVIGRTTYTLKSSEPILKTLQMSAMKLIKNKKVSKELKIGDKFISNILKTGADIIIAGKIDI